MLNSVISLLLSISIFFSSAKTDSSTNKLNYQNLTDVFGLIDQEAEDDLFDPQTYQSNYDYLAYLEIIKNTYGVKIDNDSPLIISCMLGIRNDSARIPKRFVYVRF